MALDGATLYCLAREIRAHVGERVDKISQPSREEVILTLRGKEGGGRLLLCASAASPRIHFTKVPVENPSSPPMFCMLLRKHIGSGKLTAVRQQGLERILYLDFEAVNEMGDLVIVTLAMEIMARHSNLIFLNQGGENFRRHQEGGRHHVRRTAGPSRHDVSASSSPRTDRLVSVFP